TPIFDINANYRQIDGNISSYKTTEDVFEKLLHSYTITDAIEDRNVLRFHIDYYTADDKKYIKYQDKFVKRGVIDTILDKHDYATNLRRFNAFLATSSINDAIEYYEIFKEMQEERQKQNENYNSLNITCVFSPPAEGVRDIQQIQEDLPQEKADNESEPDKKKEALKNIIDDYNQKYGTNFRLNDFDSYYQDIQKRIKDHKYPNSEHSHKNKIDIVIVVDMLLTGFDSKFLNTLYVDKNLKYHGLIQAFSRTNRVLNDTKPYGNILDFRRQTTDVDEAITLFSGVDSKRAKEIWLVDPAPVVIENYKKAVSALGDFMEEKDLVCEAHDVYNLQGYTAKINFINRFKEVQRLKTQLDQFTDLTDEQKAEIESLLSEDKLRSFRSSYLETAKELKEKQTKEGTKADDVFQQLDFEFILFSSAIIDYDYIMSLLSKYTQNEPEKWIVNREHLIKMLNSNSNLMDEQEDIIDYINSLKVGEPLNEKEIKENYNKFKTDKIVNEINRIALKYELETDNLQNFVNEILNRMIFDGEKLNILMEPLDLGWKERTKKELNLVEDLIPILKKMANGRIIAGLEAYE
ncbi:MAG: type I restriction endonuclease subunit R, partial [Candidatus Muirbacterium halophilum]|nr:type I restriction endonuclease subunit R [Candidatus Muirbacterium halophilum]